MAPIPKQPRQEDPTMMMNGGTPGRMTTLDREAQKALLNAVHGSDAVVFTVGPSPAAEKVPRLIKSLGKNCLVTDLGAQTSGAASSQEKQAFLEHLFAFSGFPAVFVKGDYVGGMEEVDSLHSRGALTSWFQPHDFDLVVVGGGSGGLAAAKEAALFGKRVACFDFVKPSPQGTTWGLGGTCVNVGCIPKKLMHQAAILGKSLKDAKKFGWETGADPVPHSWEKMKVAIQDHIASLNWGYKVQLREKKVTYFNAFGSFSGPHSLQTVDKKGVSKTITSDNFLLATGLRPKYDDVPGVKEYAITSDDLFSLSYCPGKTLLVGASYVSLECAGFLHGIGLDTTVMVRSILLRGFDQDMASRIGVHMEATGIKFINGCVPSKITKVADGQPGRYQVHGKDKTGVEKDYGEFNTIIYAIGREALTDSLNLDTCKVARNKSNKKVIVRANEQSSSCPYVYAIGDLLDGKPELTPVAIQAGRLWARRKYDRSTVLCDYANIPTTVFTPLEYGACGMSEEDAKEKHQQRIQVFHSAFTPLEYTVPKRKADVDACYAKLVCATIREKDDPLDPDNLRVLGFHYLGPNAGEVAQGFGIAFRLNATKADFDGVIGIHPTTAEIFTTMTTVKKEDEELESGGGC